MNCSSSLLKRSTFYASLLTLILTGAYPFEALASSCNDVFRARNSLSHGIVEDRPLAVQTDLWNYSFIADLSRLQGFYGEIQFNSQFSFDSKSASDAFETLRPIVAERIISRFREDETLASLNEAAFSQAVDNIIRRRFETEGGRHTANSSFTMDLEHYILRIKASGIDPNARPRSFAQLAETFGQKYVVHMTTLDRLPGILATGHLLPQEITQVNTEYSGVSGDRRYVYLEFLANRFKGRLDPQRRAEFYLRERPKPLPTNESVYFEIDTSVLDSLRWSHMNLGWSYGRMHLGTTSLLPNNQIAAFLNLMAKPENLLTPEIRNEFLIQESISIEQFVRAIHVDPRVLNDLKSNLRNAGVSEAVIALIK